jgi:ribA/ribD-fused uncharacterized protein
MTPEPQTIGSFRGEYQFLSNFYGTFIQMDHRWWPSVEHAYQGAKTLDFRDQEEIRAALTPGKAKRLGQDVFLRPDWEQDKLEVMYKLLWRKFVDPTLRGWLLATGDAWLEEGNSWGDTYWGVCNGQGSNWLGILLMLVRGEIRGDF